MDNLNFAPLITSPEDNNRIIYNGLVIAMARSQIIQQQLCDLMAMIGDEKDSVKLFAKYADLTQTAAQRINIDYAQRFGK